MAKALNSTLLVLVIAGLGLLSGCGQTDDERARRIVETYANAVTDGDYSSACRLLGPRYLKRLGGFRGCIPSLRVQWGWEGTDIRILKVESRWRQATARLFVTREGLGPSPLTLLLRRPDKDWVIAAQR